MLGRVFDAAFGRNVKLTPHPVGDVGLDDMPPSATESESSSAAGEDMSESSDDPFSRAAEPDDSQDCDPDVEQEEKQDAKNEMQREGMRKVAKAAVLPDTASAEEYETPAENVVTDELIEPLFDLTMSHFDGYFKQTTESLVTWTVENLVWSLITYTVCDVLQSFAPTATVLHAAGTNEPVEEIVDGEGNTVPNIIEDVNTKQTVPILMLHWIAWIDCISTLITVVYICIVLYSKRYNGVFSRLYMPFTQAYTGVIGVLGTMFTVVAYKATNSLPWAAAFMGGMQDTHLLVTVLVASGALTIHWVISLALTFVSTPYGRSNAAFLQLPVAFAFVLMFIIFNETGSRGNLLCTGPGSNRQTIIVANVGIMSSFVLTILSATECDPANVLSKTFHSTPNSYARVDIWALLHGIAIMITLVLYAGVRHALFSQTTYTFMIALIAFTLFVTIIQTFDWATILGSIFDTDDIAAQEMQAAQGAFLEAFMKARQQKEKEKQQQQKQRQQQPMQSVSLHARNLARMQLGLPPVGMAAIDAALVVGTPVARRRGTSSRRNRAQKASSQNISAAAAQHLSGRNAAQRTVQPIFERRGSDTSETIGVPASSANQVIKHGARISAASLTPHQFGGMFRRRRPEEMHDQQHNAQAKSRQNQVDPHRVLGTDDNRRPASLTPPGTTVGVHTNVLSQNDTVSRPGVFVSEQLFAQHRALESARQPDPITHLMRLQPGQIYTPSPSEQPQQQQSQHRDSTLQHKNSNRQTPLAAESAFLLSPNSGANTAAQTSPPPKSALSMFPDIPVSLRREAR